MATCRSGMFLNLMLPNAKTWKPYWVEIRRPFLDISTEYGKEAFTSFHLGILKVRPSKDFPDRPDVLQFYDGDGLTTTEFSVFTYDPFDILEFFKEVANTYKEWRDQVLSQRKPIVDVQQEVRPPGFFAGAVVWNVQADRILIGKPNQAQQTTVMLQDIISVTSSANQRSTTSFKFATKASSDPVEERCASLDGMKKLLDAIYTNAFLLKQQHSAEEPK